MSHTKWRWVGHLFMYVKPVKEVAFKILNNGCVYITRSIITRFPPWTLLPQLNKSLIWSIKHKCSTTRCISKQRKKTDSIFTLSRRNILKTGTLNGAFWLFETIFFRNFRSRNTPKVHPSLDSLVDYIHRYGDFSLVLRFQLHKFPILWTYIYGIIVSRHCKCKLYTPGVN